MGSITPTKTKRYRALLAMCARAARPPWWRTDWARYGIEVNVYRTIERGDWDNYARGVGDSCQPARRKRRAGSVVDLLPTRESPALWANDSAIRDAHVTIEDVTHDPRMVITVSMLGELTATTRAKMRSTRR
jgi:hypothetical protein